MKYIKSHKLFEGYSDSFENRISDFQESIKKEFKAGIDECLYYLTDEYKNSSSFKDDSYSRNGGSLALDYIIVIDKSKVNVSKLSEEVKSCIDHLIASEVEFRIQFSMDNLGIVSTSGLKMIHTDNYEESLVDEVINKIMLPKGIPTLIRNTLVKINISLW